jgi:hypothetical protein
MKKTMRIKVMKKRIILCLLTMSGSMVPLSIMAQQQDTATGGDTEPVATISESEQQTDTEPKVDTEIKELSGISIIGNDEAPKSLYIVPWQNSEVGVATSLQSGLFDDNLRPLQREEFARELNYYELTN